MRQITIIMRDDHVLVTNAAGDGGILTCKREDVATRIKPWFPNAPEDVSEALGELQCGLNAGRNTDGVQTYLGITIN